MKGKDVYDTTWTFRIFTERMNEKLHCKNKFNFVFLKTADATDLKVAVLRWVVNSNFYYKEQLN